jgi:CRISPR-associated protein Cmr1
VKALRTITLQAPTAVPDFTTKNRTTRTYEMSLITPMYGGGVRAGANDTAFPVRPASIRGQLRFWWRATRGAKFTTPEELHDEESEIWGSTETAGSVVVRVTNWSPPGSRNYVGPRADNYGFDRSGPEAYVLFPASADTARHNLVKEGLTFTMEISFENAFEQDVMCAVWAWVNFGGLGARTRRGCGALFCRDFAPIALDAAAVGKRLRNKVKEYELCTKAGREWPTFCQKIFLKPPVHGTLLGAWSESVEPMQEFRQGRDFARNHGDDGPVPGRSRWPEPDTLRREFHHNHPDHAPDPAMPEGFPRAAFGLPIIFHFKDEEDPSSQIYPKFPRSLSTYKTKFSCL